MSAHQATLDYVCQPLHTCSTEEEQRRRYEHTQFAEEQGRVTHQWLSLQETLSSQVRTCRPPEFSYSEVLGPTEVTCLTCCCCFVVVFRSSRWRRS